MRKALRLSGYIYQDIVDLLTMIYELKIGESNKEIADDMGNIIDKLDGARNAVFEARQNLQQIYNETYDD